jgi:NAD(P)-dependent dehydrogenase (short-subunit alcohol dehydrogenase family)
MSRYEEIMKLTASTFLVTGGSSGLGAACVKMLSEEGANVIIADLNTEDGERIAATSQSARFVRTDVTDEAEVQNAVNAAVRSYGKLNGAINCAGICPPERILGKTGPHSIALFSKVIAINLIGTFNVTRLSAEAIARAEPGPEGERGIIIHTSSIAAFDGQIGQTAYSASKGGVAAMTLPAARELARYGIRVVAIAPGIFDTPLMAGLPEQAKRSLGDQVPFPSRLGRPVEYASLVKHVIENIMLNGEVIRLDGALRMAPK